MDGFDKFKNHKYNSQLYNSHHFVSDMLGWGDLKSKELEKQELANFVMIVTAIVGVAVTGIQMYAKSKALKKAKAADAASNNVMQTQIANQNLQAIYNIENEKDSTEESSITIKYILGIASIITVLLLVLYFNLKK